MKNESVILTIDTHKQNSVCVGVKRGDVLKEKRAERYHSDQVVLGLIKELLASENLKFSAIAAIEVHLGPGSYTGLRVGAAIANTLGWILGVSVNGKSIGTLADPVYN